MYQEFIFEVTQRKTKFAALTKVVCSVRARSQSEAASRLRSIPENVAVLYLHKVQPDSFALDSHNPPSAEATHPRRYVPETLKIKRKRG